MAFSIEELVDRTKLIIKEIKAFPTDSPKSKTKEAPSMRDVPYWASLLQQINAQAGSLQTFYDRFIPPKFLTGQQVDFPSPEQDEATTQMLERSSLLNRDRAGSGKTAPFIKAKFALEQLVLDGQKINPLIVCPNFVLSSWQAKLREYLDYEPNVLTITSANREEGLTAFEKGVKDGTLDFTLVSYDALFRHVDGKAYDDIVSELIEVSGHGDDLVGESTTLADRLLASLEASPNQFMLGLDESHNARNPRILRAKAVRKLASAADYLFPMTGNPFPDNLEDIGETASLLDPENYPTAEHFNRAYDKDPRLIRLFLRRFSKEPVIGFGDIEGSPEVEIREPTYLGMSSDEQALYWGILNHREFHQGAKFALLRLAATDGRALLPENYGSPRLKARLEEFFKENPELLETARRIESTKYKELDKLVEDVISRGEKIVIWTKLREGITTHLEERYAKHGCVRIDGTVSAESGSQRYSDRDIARLKAQTDPDAKVVVASIGALREGQDLHSFNNVAFVMRDYSPGLNDQAIGRSARRGQHKKVTVHSFLMRGTMDQGIFENIEQTKREGIEEAEGGYELSKDQRSALSRKKPIIKQVSLRKYTMNSHSSVRLMSGHMINKGAENNQAYLDREENAMTYAQHYNFNWLTSYSAHTARLIARVANEIEEQGSPLEKIVDLGSGPATVSRVLERPSLCVDINPFQLENGKRECEAIGVDIETKRANIEDLSDVDSEQFDLAVMSLALHYGNYESGGRKRMLLEANRLVKEGGYVILTLPSKIVQGEGRELLEHGLESIGLQPIEERTSVVRAIDGVEKDYEVYIAVCQKTHSNPQELYEDNRFNGNFILNPDFQYREMGKKDGSGCSGPKGKQGYSHEICSMFEFLDSGDVLGSKPKGSTPKPTIEPEKPEAKTPEELIQALDKLMARRKKK